MDENAAERKSTRPPGEKPAPISEPWTATPAPQRPQDAEQPPADPALGVDGPETHDAPPAETTAANTEAGKPVGLRAGDLDRRRVAAVLHEALGKGQLTISEFDERTAVAWSARYVSDLDELTADLIPAAPGLDAAHHQSGVPTQAINPPASTRVTGDGGPSTAVAVFSGFERKGVWTIPEKFTAVAVMGGGVIDLRYANFGAQHVRITATAIMGGIEIIVPDDVRVHVAGIGFMGGFDDSRKWPNDRVDPGPDAPSVTVDGFAMMGGVAVSRKASGPKDRRG